MINQLETEVFVTYFRCFLFSLSGFLSLLLLTCFFQRKASTLWRASGNKHPVSASSLLKSES